MNFRFVKLNHHYTCQSTPEQTRLNIAKLTLEGVVGPSAYTRASNRAASS